jgi:DNA-binding NarL/FixJ family response regulator
MIRVLIADDQELLRDALHVILDAQDDIEVVAVAADGAEALRKARETMPDVIVMDVRMPQMDGIEATRRLRQAGFERLGILILTTFDLDEYVYEALRAGAGGFLLKDAPRTRLIDAVRTIAAGDSLLAPAITRRLIERYVSSHPTSAPPPELEQLSPREIETLTALARGDSNAEIAAQLYLSESTIKTHVASILRKLELRDRVQVVVWAYETGFVTPGTPIE